MTFRKTETYLFVYADEGKILVYGEDRFFTAFLPADTEVKDIKEVDFEKEVENL